MNGPCVPEMRIEPVPSASTTAALSALSSSVLPKMSKSPLPSSPVGVSTPGWVTASTGVSGRVSRKALGIASVGSSSSSKSSSIAIASIASIDGAEGGVWASAPRMATPCRSTLSSTSYDFTKPPRAALS